MRKVKRLRIIESFSTTINCIMVNFEMDPNADRFACHEYAKIIVDGIMNDLGGLIHYKIIGYALTKNFGDEGNEIFLHIYQNNYEYEINIDLEATTVINSITYRRGRCLDKDGWLKVLQINKHLTYNI